jgi:hypothetical protein
MQWMTDHGMFTGRKCEKHPDAVHTSDTCQVVIKKGQVCRRALSVHTPFFHSKSKIFAKETLAVIERLSRASTMKAMRSDLHLGKNTLTEVIRKLAGCCLWESQTHGEKFNKCSVDETYFGKRKYNRGRRTRARGAWFMSCTEIVPDGSSGRTYWCAVRNVDRESAYKFIVEHIVGPRSTVYTDSARIYATLSDICRHGQVNHFVEWKSDAGVHTNHAEGCHGVVKRFMRFVTTTYGKGSHSLEERVALATSLFNRPEPADRLQYLLQVTKRHWGDPPNYVSTSDGEQDEALSCSDTGEEEIIFDEVDERQMEEGDVDDTGDNIPHVLDDDGDDDDDDGDLDLAEYGLDALHRGALREACVAGVIPKEVVMLALAGHNVPAIFLPAELPKGNAKKKLKEATKVAVVTMYDNHYVGMIINKTIRKLEIYDSERRRDPIAKAAAAQVANQFAFALTGRWMKQMNADNKSAFHASKRGATEDCGVHTVNMLLHVMGVEEVYDRARLAGLVVEPAVEMEREE